MWLVVIVHQGESVLFILPQITNVIASLKMDATAEDASYNLIHQSMLYWPYCFKSRHVIVSLTVLNAG